MHAALSRGAHVVSFTEVYDANERVLRRVCNERGYVLAQAAGNDAVCVRADGVVVDSGATLVNKGEKGKPPNGGHSVRHAAWVLVRFPDVAVPVFYVSAHWVTGATRFAARRRKHAAMSAEIVRLVTQHTRAGAVAFFAGDTNVRDTPGSSEGYETLEAAGLSTCWDDLGIYPATHGKARKRKTIDVIGSYDGDERVVCEKAQAWPKVVSDHAPISAWYAVTP